MRNLLARVPPAGWTLVVQGIELVASIAATILVGRVLGTEAMGSFAFALNLAGLLAIFLLFGTGEIAIQMYQDAENTSPRAVYGASLIVVACGSLACLAVGTAVVFGMGLSFESGLATYIALVTLLVNGLAATLNNAILAFDAAGKDVGNIVVSRAVLLAGVVAAGLAGSLIGVLCAYVAAAIVLSALRARLVGRHLFPVRPVFDGEVTRALWHRGRQIGVGSIFGTISNRSDMLLLEGMTDTTQVGLYGASYRIINGVQAGAVAVSTALYPGLLRAIQAGKMTRTRRLYLAFPLAVAAFLIAIAFTVSDPLVTLLLGDDFAPARPVFKLLLLASACQTVLMFLAKYLIARGKEGVMPTAQAVSAATNLTLNVIFIPSILALGAAWATLAAEVVLLLIYGVVLVRLGRAAVQR
ncbi:MAG: oligosaccharide flippase family protein [Myxococcales bacterium]|nr:oligosaccharide flippase family protein [Myxococcales bacterium]